MIQVMGKRAEAQPEELPGFGTYVTKENRQQVLQALGEKN